MTEIRLVPPPHDGLAEAFRTAAARRRKKAATTGGAGLTAAALVFVALTGGSNQVLTQEPAPPARGPQLVELVPVAPAPAADTTSEVVDDSTSQERADARRPASARSPRVAATPDPGSAVAARPRVVANPPAPAATPSSRYRTSPVTRQDRQVDIPYENFGCVVESSSRNGRLCSQVRLYNSGDTSILDLYLCNSTTSDKRLTFPRKDDVDYTVLRGNEVMWRWSVDHPSMASPHDVVVYTGTCTVWSTKYPKVDQAGRALPKGAYALRGSIDSVDAGLAATAVGQFTIN